MKKGSRVLTTKETDKIARDIKSKLNSWNKKMKKSL